MPRLVWDELDKRIYEGGIDNGVLYLSDGSGVPWNGLTSVVEKFDKQSEEIYYDGTKVNDIVVLGCFSGLLRAITYPDEFLELEGLGQVRAGVFVGDQQPKRFGLCYRTKVGSELNGEDHGYKLHIIYNLMAMPSDKSYASISSTPSASQFEWLISAIPEQVSGFLPTAHIIISSVDVHPWLLEDLENILYGSDSSSATLMSISDLITFIEEWSVVEIVDNGDGTWTASSNREGFIELDVVEQLFTLNDVNAEYLDSETYVISDTE
jgi:hypothetical protein